MPRFDGTGPYGYGPGTGGGFGYCAPMPADAGAYSRGMGRGEGRLGGGRGYQRGGRRGAGFYGAGRGRGLFCRRWFYGPAPEKSILQAEAAELKTRLEAVERHIAEMESQPAESQDE